MGGNAYFMKILKLHYRYKCKSPSLLSRGLGMCLQPVLTFLTWTTIFSVFIDEYVLNNSVYKVLRET